MTPIELRLRQARERAELTQSELAEKVGVRQATISRIENGRIDMIELDLLDRLCQVLDVEPGTLLERVRSTRKR